MKTIVGVCFVLVVLVLFAIVITDGFSSSGEDGPNMN